MPNYHIIACHVLKRELDHFAGLSKNTVTFHYLEQGLHNTPEILRERLQAAVDAAPENADAVLLGYGLCSNGLVGIRARKKRLVIARAHDCITFLLGSKERYREYFDTHPGTYWYSPGWIETGTQPGRTRCEQLLKEYAEKYGEENAQYLMEMEQAWIKNYSNAAYVDLGLGDSAAHKAFTKECAAWLGWRYDELAGDPVLLLDFMEGNWDSADFLIVEPGEAAAASNDAEVVKAVR
ncbi:MAG: DUF1638 domain-containing protein [Fibrobacterota bacterium]